MKVHVEIDEKELRKIALAHCQNVLGDITLNDNDVNIQVKSKQNYKSEWEEAAFRATVEKHT